MMLLAVATPVSAGGLPSAIEQCLGLRRNAGLPSSIERRYGLRPNQPLPSGVEQDILRRCQYGSRRDPVRALATVVMRTATTAATAVMVTVMTSGIAARAIARATVMNIRSRVVRTAPVS